VLSNTPLKGLNNILFFGSLLRGGMIGVRLHFPKLHSGAPHGVISDNYSKPAPSGWYRYFFPSQKIAEVI
jgi:hypothetical protein